MSTTEWTENDDGRPAWVPTWVPSVQAIQSPFKPSVQNMEANLKNTRKSTAEKAIEITLLVLEAVAFLMVILGMAPGALPYNLTPLTGLALAVAVGALATKTQETATVAGLQKDRDDVREESELLKAKLEELEDRFFQADLQFEQTQEAMRKEFDTSLKVKLDTLREELRREKDAAIKELKAAQESQIQ